MPRKDYTDKSGLAYYWLEAHMGRVLLVVLFAGIGLWGLLLEGRAHVGLIQKLARGMGPELAGIVITALTIEALTERRQVAERKRTLISQLGSKYRDVTEMAVIELRNRDWLYDGSLAGSRLVSANLSEIDLERADLTSANLNSANLGKAKMKEAKLREVIMRYANLSGADLWDVDLGRASLESARLSRANLLGANLAGANLWRADLSSSRLVLTDLSEANLSDANLSGARLGFVGGSIVPYRPILQMANLRQTDLKHANLSGVTDWSIEQLQQAKTLNGAIMPDGVQLAGETFGFGTPGSVTILDLLRSPMMKRIEGPTFEEWKTQYLAKHGGTERDIRSRTG